MTKTNRYVTGAVSAFALLAGAAALVHAAPVFDPAQMPQTNGTVQIYSLTPRGDVDGLILNDGTEVHFPPHLSTALVAIVKPGDAVTVHGLRAMSVPLVSAASITNDATGKSVTDTGPGGRRGVDEPMQVQGRVKAALHGPRGEINGALMEDGTILRLPPPEAKRRADLLAPGQSVVAEGDGYSGSLGKVVEVSRLGPTADRMSQVGPAQGPSQGAEGSKGPRRAGRPRSTPASAPRLRHAARWPPSSFERRRSPEQRGAPGPVGHGAPWPPPVSSPRITMLSTLPAAPATWVIAAAATSGVIIRPFGLPEATWALAGAAGLVALGLLPWPDAVAAVARGTDVYLFLAGMMLAAELARREGLFAWLAFHAVARARGAKTRLFVLVYCVGVGVTALLSNDATAVVLTPAVYAAARAAGAEALPYLLACAFVANAASFVLPISNPANLVIFGDAMPSLAEWLLLFTPASLASVAATFAILYASQRPALRGPLGPAGEPPHLSRGGRCAAVGLLVIAAAILATSALGLPLGLTTAVAGLTACGAVLSLTRQSPLPLVKDVTWGVLPLVAGLFVIVDAIGRTGLIARLAEALDLAASASPVQASWWAGTLVALATNLTNNLPAGLLAGSAVQLAHVPAQVTAAVLIGVDLGPNLSVTGSLATILWLVALRREGEHVGTWSFLKLGILVMPPALALALAALTGLPLANLAP